MNPVTHLRISLTQRCNIQCFYCHHEGQEQNTHEMTYDEIMQRMRDMVSLGVQYVKITGGEPLLRSDIAKIIQGMRSLPEIKDISMTTNGILLKSMAVELKQSGLDRINIGCDTLYSSILPKSMPLILPGIEEAKKVGLKPIKVNMVVLKGLNDEQIPSMIQYAAQLGFILQLIELIPNGDPHFDQYYLSLDDWEKKLSQQSQQIVERDLQSRKQYVLGKAVIEIVGPTHEGFCSQCKKIRITSDGKIKPCLMKSDNLVDYAGPASIQKAIDLKKPFHE